MWRLLCSGQPSGSMQALALLEQLPQVITCLRSSSAATASLQQLLQYQHVCSFHTVPLQHSSRHVNCSSQRCTYSSTADEGRSAASSSSSTSEPQPEEPEQQPILQPAVTADAAGPSELPIKHPVATRRHHKPLAEVEQSSFVTLPPQATASGYRESFLAATTPSSSSSSTGSKRVGLEQLQLPQERLRIQLRQDVQAEEVQEDAEAHRLSKSLVGKTRSFDTPAAATAADSAQQQQQQLSADDRELLEKLVGIMTKEGKKSRARRLLLDAMHIIKQQVAKGQHA